jgi:hypothetical protein
VTQDFDYIDGISVCVGVSVRYPGILIRLFFAILILSRNIDGLNRRSYETICIIKSEGSVMDDGCVQISPLGQTYDTDI